MAFLRASILSVYTEDEVLGLFIPHSLEVISPFTEQICRSISTCMYSLFMYSLNKVHNLNA